ncbi:MAG: hypothetical protein JNK02_16960 [Planctomycetes bacterium]|nr:hypothetical protein [Planctomycetota bacterium]
MDPKPTPTDRRRGLTAFERLDREEREIHAALQAALLAAGEDVCRITDVRGLVRRHPALALGAAAALGAALAPLLSTLSRGALRAAGRHGGRTGPALGLLLRHLTGPR